MKQGLIHNIYSSENAGRLGSEIVLWDESVDRKDSKVGEEEKLCFTHLMLQITRFELENNVIIPIAANRGACN